MQEIGRGLVAVGLGLAVLGALIWGLGVVLPGFRLGRLPGDVVVEKPGFGLYVPFASMILLSIVVSGLLWLAGRLSR